MTRIKLTVAASGLVVVGVIVALAIIMPRAASAQGQAATPLTSAVCGCQETSFGDLTADAVRDNSGAQVALVAGISFKNGTLPPGPITLDRVSVLLANPDEVWAVSQLKGSQLRGALEHSVRSAPLPNLAFLQVSGLTFSFNLSGPRDQRVQAVQVGGAPLDDNATYLVAMPLSLAKGGSGYFRFFTKEAIQRQGTEGLAAVVVAYANKRGSVTYTGTGRITANP